MARMTEKQDKAMDRKRGIPEGSKRDQKMDRARGLPADKPKKRK